jgi:hypothetical protein
MSNAFALFATVTSAGVSVLLEKVSVSPDVKFAASADVIVSKV